MKSKCFCFLFAFFLPLLFSHLGANQIKKVVKLAKQFRTDPKLPVEQEKKRLRKIVQSSLACLSVYTHNTIEEAINAFLANSNILNHYISKSYGGQSQDLVFLIKNQQEQLCYVVKAFRNPEILLQEISAYELIRELDLAGVTPIKCLAAALYKGDESEWGLLLETASKGVGIDQFVIKGGIAAQKACVSMGQSFARLHGVKSDQTGFIPSSFFSSYDAKVDNILNNNFITSELAKQFPLSNFVNYTHSIKEEARNIPIFYTFCHGDAHLSNLFYDAALDKFTFIDASKLHKSVDIERKPLRDGIVDFVRVESCLRRRGFGFIKNKEIDSLVATFRTAYEAEAGPIPKRLELFYQISHSLSGLLQFSGYASVENPRRSALFKHHFESEIEYIKSQINANEHVTPITSNPSNGFPLPGNEPTANFDAMAKQNPMNKLVFFAKQFRSNRSLPPQKEQHRLHKLAKEAIDCLPVYEFDTLEEGIKAFLLDTLNKTKYSIIRSEYGHSKDQVFLIKNRKNRLRYVVKAFKNPRHPSCLLLPEISGYELIERLNLPGVKPINCLAAALYRGKGTEWGLLLESASEGVSMNQMVFAGDISTKEKAFARMGQSFARLHATRSAQKGPIPKYFISKCDERMNTILQNPFIVNELSKQIPITEFVEFIKSTRDKVVVTPIFHTFCHGDAHLINLFYDAKNDYFSFIDAGNLHLSTDLNGYPTSDGREDIVRVENSLHKIALGILTEEEINRLISAFRLAYQSESNIILNDPVMQFYNNMAKMGNLVKFSTYAKEDNTQLRSLSKGIFEHSIRWFKTQIKSQPHTALIHA